MKKEIDALGARMKDHEHRTRYFIPKRTYTVIRLDGKAFHTFTRGCVKPFDRMLMTAMQEATLELCKDIQNVKMGYTQSDEITLILTDFDTRDTCQWFDGNLQKISSVSASIVTAAFNKAWQRLSLAAYMEDFKDAVVDHAGLFYAIEQFIAELPTAKFDSRVYTVSEYWEAYNSVLWRQQDASKNSIQMVAQRLYSHAELQGKNTGVLQEMIFQKGQNWNDFPTDCKRGAFVVRSPEGGWMIDQNAPILSQDKDYFFSRVPLMDQPQFDIKEIVDAAD